MQTRARYTCVIVVVGIVVLQLAGSVDAQKATPRDRSTENLFRYAIVENSVSHEDNPKLISRHIEVLLDERAFSEKTLRVLFDLVSKRYATPKNLNVDVYTNLEQIMTPEERDYGSVSGGMDTNPDKFLWAVYLRNPYAHFFRYSPVDNKSDIRTVELAKP